MRGTPKRYNTVQDFKNTAQMYPAEAAAALENLLDSRFIWQEDKILAEDDKGIEDDEHMIIETSREIDGKDQQIRVQMKRVEDANAEVFRIGWTVQTANSFIKKNKGE